MLNCRTNDDRNPTAGVGGLCVGIFSSLQCWLCDRVLCALQCAKNSVGSCRQSHGCLYMCSMLFRVTHNKLIYATQSLKEKNGSIIYLVFFILVFELLLRKYTYNILIVDSKFYSYTFYISILSKQCHLSPRQ